MLTRSIIVFTAIAGCTDPSDSQQHGGFALQQLEGLARTSTDTAALTEQTSFDLGELRASRSYYFILSNTGDTDITDITLTSSSPAFSVEPSSIDALPPGGGAIIPIIRISAVHGVAVDGVGLAPLLPPGQTTATISVRGTTTVDGPPDVQLDVTLRVDAKVMDVELRSGTQIIDLTQPSGSISTNLGGLGFARAYFYTPANGAQLTNTGNIDIDVTYYNGRVVSGHATASPNQTVPVVFADATTFVALASAAVTDNKRLQLGNDGVAYFALMDPR
jgi:hypothetical protein